MKHFKIQELVGPETYKSVGSRALELFDDRILWTVDAIRDYFGRPIIINNWHRGGKFSDRGFRERDSAAGVKYSQHRFGRAVDFDVRGLLAEIVRDEIRKKYKIKSAFQYITAMEINTPHIHIDCRYNPTGILFEFEP